jgi:hypothetical protein
MCVCYYIIIYIDEKVLCILNAAVLSTFLIMIPAVSWKLLAMLLPQ